MKKPPRPAPLSLRLTPEDLSYIDHVRGDLSRHAYIRAQALDPLNPPPRPRIKAPMKDHKALAEVVALFGRSHIASNLNQLAKAANSGSLPLTPEVESDLREAIRLIADIRKLLIAALDLSDARP